MRTTNEPAMGARGTLPTSKTSNNACAVRISRGKLVDAMSELRRERSSFGTLSDDPPPVRDATRVTGHLEAHATATARPVIARDQRKAVAVCRSASQRHAAR